MTPLSPWSSAQLAAGVIAARHRGDPAGAEALLASFPDETAKVRGFHVLSELCLSLVRAQTGQSMEELVRELPVQLGQADQVLPPSTRP
jgi:hypothetical protein